MLSYGKEILVIILAITVCFASTTNHVQAASLLEIVLYTNSPVYWLADPITVYGYLFYNSTTVSDGIVCMQIDNPLHYPILFRTLPTGTPPSTPESIEITSLFLSDNFGKPKSTVMRNTIAYFNITLKNNNATKLNFNFTISCFDSAQGIIDSNYFATSLLAHDTNTMVIPFYLPDRVPTGSAIAYANTFTKQPKDGGYAISKEKSATFTITSIAGFSAQGQAQTLAAEGGVHAMAGTFATQFKIPIYHIPGIGNYTIYTSSRYRNQLAKAQTQIRLKVADLNGDNKVNVLDLIIIANNIGWTGPPGGIPADVNADGKVNVLDLVITVRFFGWVGS